MRELGLILQESEMRPAAERTIGGFLREKMDGGERRRRRRTVKRRMGFRCIVCCGAAASRPGSTDVNFPDADPDEEDANDYRDNLPTEASPVDPEAEPSPAALSDPGCVSGMNLAEALAAERHFRATPEQTGGTETDGRTVVSLMRLLEGDAARSREKAEEPLRVSLLTLMAEAEEGDGGGKRSETGCCVCMIREKGAAFIPCGHTFCRICSRELWLSRGSCPLCNRPVVEILDIF